MMIDHVKTVPELPSARVKQEIPGDLEQLIMKCLEKDQDQRPAGAEELADSLRSCKDWGAWNRDNARSWWMQHMAAK